MKNQTVRNCYRELNSLLEQGDDTFIDDGPETLQKYTSEPEFFNGWEPEEPEDDSYTRTLLMGGGEPDEMAMIYMKWPAGYELPPHSHHGRPCFEELITGQLEITELDAEELENGEYLLEPRKQETVNERETAAVDHRETNEHSVVAKEASGSIHVYPASYGECIIFNHVEGNRYWPEKVDLEVDKDVSELIL